MKKQNHSTSVTRDPISLLHVEGDAALGHAHDEEHQGEHGVDPGKAVLGTPVQPPNSHPHPVQPPLLGRVP